MRFCFNLNDKEKVYFSERNSLLGKVNPEDIAEHFPLFASRQLLVKNLVKYELFKLIQNVKGSIIECGVYQGSGLLYFANLSTIFEPYAINRKIIGFDTFKEGYPHVDEEKDKTPGAKVGHYSDVKVDILEKCIELYDLNRPIGHVPKVVLVKGDAVKTIPQFFKENPYMLVSLLYIDFDLYVATKVALETIVPRMPKGSVIAFGDINAKEWPGETIALLEFFNIRDIEIKKFPFESHITYIVL